MAKYPYLPLTSAPGSRALRLIELHPDFGSASIKCNIIHASLDDAPEYSAVSYRWGDTSDLVSLACNNEGDTLAITRNLDMALRTFRSPYVTRLLWADSICINQADLDDRRDQVLLMADIYRSAQAVLVWLGPPPERDGRKPGIHPFDLISQIAMADGEVPFGAAPLTRMAMVMRQLNKRHFEAIEWVVNNEYFRRAWILQEVALARHATLYCGSDSLPWKVFIEALVLLGEMGVLHLMSTTTAFPLAIESTHEGVHSTKEGKEDGTGSIGLEPMLKLLLLHRWRLATDPRDKIYSLIGLARDSGPGELDLRPDYSLGVAAVYERLTRSILDASGNLDAITVAGIPGERPGTRHGLASWAPDWASTERRSPIALGGLFLGDERPSFCASGNSSWIKASPPAAASDSAVGGTREGLLGVQAQVLDVVGELGSVMRPELGVSQYSPSYSKLLESHYRWGQVLTEWEQMCGARSVGKTYAATGEPILDAYLQTLIVGNIASCDKGDSTAHSGGSGGPDAKKEQLARFDRYRRKVGNLARLNHKLATSKLGFLFKPARAFVAIALILAMPGRGHQNKDPGEIREIGNDVAIGTTNRRFALSKQKHLIGMVPAAAQPGDCICLVSGCSVPLLLRRGGDPNCGSNAADCTDQDAWRLVGECYFHGAMNGELYEQDKCRLTWLS